MLRQICLALFLAAVSPALLAADEQGTTEIESVIQKFHQALDRHDVTAIEALVSADVVVLENGHRNDGWPDFRENHLIAEFKEPPAPSKWEFVKVAAGSEMAWAIPNRLLARPGRAASRPSTWSGPFTSRRRLGLPGRWFCWTGV